MAIHAKPVDPAGTEATEDLNVTERDIVFDCPTCQNQIVVDQEGAGGNFPCPHCAASVTVPNSVEPPAEAPPAPAPPAHHAPAADSVVSAAVAKTYDFSRLSPQQVQKRIKDLTQILKENQSQRTEIRGYINQATIQLRRHQLQLEKLATRQVELEQELAAAYERMRQG